MGACAEHFSLHGAFRRFDQTCYLEVGESKTLGLVHHLAVDVLDLAVAFKHVRELYDIVQTLDKPAVNLCQLNDAVDGVALFQSLRDGKHAHVGRV